MDRHDTWDTILSDVGLRAIDREEALAIRGGGDRCTDRLCDCIDG